MINELAKQSIVVQNRKLRVDGPTEQFAMLMRELYKSDIARGLSCRQLIQNL